MRHAPVQRNIGWWLCQSECRFNRESGLPLVRWPARRARSSPKRV